MQSEVVVAEHLSKQFRIGFWLRKVVAARDVTFTVREGEIFGLLGPNGAGKTTTIKCLLGLIAPTSGRAVVLGEPAGSRRARAQVGNPALYEFLRGEELLEYLGRLSGMPRAEARKRALTLMETVGLAGGHRRDIAVRKYSKGMVQRLALAQSLLSDPRMVILDEPMSGLDPIGRKDVRDLILKLRDEGRTVLFSSHILSDAEQLCDRVGLIVDGVVRDCGALHELLAPTVKSVEVVAEAVPAELRARLVAEGALERDARLVVSARDQAGADAAVRALVQAGARIVQVTPNRESLEDLFVRRVEESREKARAA
jgi:ABC-2 type transport system ATP-binding protein